MEKMTHDDGWLRFKKFIDDGVENTLRPVGPELPEGVECIDGKLVVMCCQCEKYVELEFDIGELPATGYKHYCGSSPRCCP